ncbi:hypothetical protein PLESTB_001150800 [Pleodorina starrii]|uniref:Uncharacterized protein n=1 Tax=Pleodorina starrii TaxID=330485 RepID=A0A9W6F524_9CHLO|nr:hypothetical protein PLESTM_001784800 [Pleodorina starrii]GLC56803.1 hypothetical protein PLESTB_001150800 [Pleodorina starrii]GLC68139.1 hypothetical protein PLESTF_000652700 [Pleodorina starrii]
MQQFGSATNPEFAHEVTPPGLMFSNMRYEYLGNVATGAGGVPRSAQVQAFDNNLTPVMPGSIPLPPIPEPQIHERLLAEMEAAKTQSRQKVVSPAAMPGSIPLPPMPIPDIDEWLPAAMKAVKI